MSGFGDYLKRHLKTSELRTQMALAAAIDMDYGQLNKIFTGKTQRPEIETLEKIAPAIKRPIEEVMLAAGYPAPKSTHHERAISTTVGISQEGAALAATGAGYATGSAELQQLAEIGRSVVQLVNERRNIIPGPRVRVSAEVQRVPVVNGMSATELSSGVRQVEQWIDVASSQLNGAQDPVAYIIQGDCLQERWGIRTGDTLIVDAANREPLDGQIVAARINDDTETAKEFHRVPGGVDLRPTSQGYDTIEIRGADHLVIIGVYVTYLPTGKR